MMQESYSNSRQSKRRMSRKEIEATKKNMKKVPIIQQKSQEYHKAEEQEAENLLNKIKN
jgi:hypothetical protein